MNVAYRERVYTKDFSLYIDEVEYKIKNARPHKQYELVLLNDYIVYNVLLSLLKYSTYSSISGIKKSLSFIFTRTKLFESIIKRAIEKNLVEINLIDFREFSPLHNNSFNCKSLSSIYTFLFTKNNTSFILL